MANIEMQLISRIVRKGELSTALNWGISTSDLITDEARNYFEHLMRYAQDPNTNKGQIGERAMAELYPNFDFSDDDYTATETLCLEVRKNRLRADLRGSIQDLLNRINDDPLEAAAAADRHIKGVLELGYNKKTDVYFKDALERNIIRYEQREAGMDLSVSQWPWRTMNEATLGIEAGDYIIYYGRPKSMKSWVLACHIAYIFNMGQRPLIYTKEMHADNIFQRVAACIAQLPYQALRSGNLLGDERERLFFLKKMASDLMTGDDMVCLSGQDAPNGADTVEWLGAKIEKYTPNVCFIDGMYLMSDSKGSSKQKDNERVQNVSRAIRQLALSTQVPMVCTLQANRKAANHNEANLDEVAFSDSISQDATNIIRVINEKDKPTIALVMGGAREYTLHGLRIGGTPATDFDDKGSMTEREIMGAKEGDASEAENGDPGAHTTGKNGNKKDSGKDPKAEKRRIEKMHEVALRKQMKMV